MSKYILSSVAVHVPEDAGGSYRLAAEVHDILEPARQKVAELLASVPGATVAFQQKTIRVADRSGREEAVDLSLPHGLDADDRKLVVDPPRGEHKRERVV